MNVLLVLDLLLVVVAGGLWVAAWPARGTKAGTAVLVAAVLATAARATVVALLGRAGWWFMPDRLVTAVPLTLLAAVVGGALVRRRTLPAPVPLVATYVAVAGVAMQFLVGYPVTVGAIAAVFGPGAAALLAWRLPARTARVAVLAATAVALLAAGVTAAVGSRLPDRLDHNAHGADGGHAAHAAAPGVSIADLRGPDRPPTRRFTLTARAATITLPSGTAVDAWTFNGRLPGPELRVTEGDVVEVTLRNELPGVGVTLHWHGYDVPAGEDGVAGVTQDAVPPGGTFTYRFEAEDVGSYWYHSHEMSSEAVRRGLYGTLVVTPDRPEDPAETDITLAMHRFHTGAVVLGGSDRRETRAVPAGRRVRLRLVNTDNDAHRVAVGGTPYTVSAIDGRDLTGPTVLTAETTLRLPAGGRYDVEFTMPAGAVHIMVDGRNSAGLLLGGGAIPAHPAGTDLDITRYGRPAPGPFGRFDKDYTLVLDRLVRFLDGVPGYAYTVNGGGYPDIPPLQVDRGDSVRTTVVNRGTESHPMHLHGHHVLVLSRNGRPVTGSPLWLDTFDVLPGEVWRVAFRADNPGIWLDHCHNLPHARQGMVLHVAYRGVTSPYAIGRRTPNHPE
jgi:FtsP/CotA-like multicopper oxidase with cupredoxin domain